MRGRLCLVLNCKLTVPLLSLSGLVPRGWVSIYPKHGSVSPEGMEQTLAPSCLLAFSQLLVSQMGDTGHGQCCFLSLLEDMRSKREIFVCVDFLSPGQCMVPITL